MATIHRTTMTPTKLGLLAGRLPGKPWWQGGDHPRQLDRAGDFRLDDPAGEVVEVIRVLGDPPPAAGFVESGWNLPDRTPVRGPVALLR